MAAELNPKEALLVALYQNPELKIKKLWNYDNDYYLLMAVNDEGEMYSDPYYLVNKETGGMRGYSSAEDMDKFLEIIDTDPLVTV
jgi:hypothetical protein